MDSTIDNATIHSAKDTMKWFEYKKIPKLDWSANSRDLNQMDNFGGIIIRNIYRPNGHMIQYISKADLKSFVRQGVFCYLDKFDIF